MQNILLFVMGVLSCISLTACGRDPVQARNDYATAMKYLRGDGVTQDEAKGISYLQRSAEEGSADGQLALGFAYIKGRGVTKDTARGVQYFTQAALQGNRDAQYDVGLAMARGDGVKKNVAEAFKWFEMAALQDDAGAQFNIAVMYVNGEGTAKDVVKAYAWFSQAAKQQYQGAKEAMDSAHAALTPEQLKALDSEVSAIAKRVSHQKSIAPVQIRTQQQEQPL